MAETQIPGGWWTEAIVGQIRTMRTTQDFSPAAQRQLADLLETAGCPETEIITAFRLPLKKWAAAREIAVLLGGVYMEDAWLLDQAHADLLDAADMYEAEIEYDYEWFMESYNRVNGGDYCVDVLFDVPYKSIASREACWAAFERVTGIDLRVSSYNAVFADARPDDYSCAC